MNKNLSCETGIEEVFVVPQSLSAMAKTFYVQVDIPLIQGTWFIKHGTTVTGIKAIAVGEEIREVDRLIEKYKKSNGEDTKVKDWIKARGTAILSDGENTVRSEVHWYQCLDVGKKEFKAKRWNI